MTFTQPDGIVVRDGKVWITEESGDIVDEISATDFLLRIALPPGSGPEQLAVGPDDSLWTSEYSSGQIARVTLSG
jgi:streptogramin lyase